MTVVTRLRDAMNAHNLDDFLDCFHDDWRWTGTRAAGGALDLAGVMVLGVRDGRVAWGRLYIEPVEAGTEDINAAMRKMTSGASQSD